MATIFGLNAVGSGIGGDGTNSMYRIGQLTPEQKAAAAIKSDIKKLTAVTVDEKPAPGELAPGQVAKVENDNGKVEYYVGTANGGLSKPLSSVSSAVSTVTTEVKKVEQAQSVALRSTQKIELSELEQSLQEQGLKPAEIKPILKAEKEANTAEVTQLKGLLAEPGLQYATRDEATNTFVNNVVDGKLTPSALPTSLLNYNDVTYSPKALQSINNANAAVTEFQFLHGMNTPYLGKGNEQTGLDPYAIYQALDGNHIETIRDPVTNAVTDYRFSDEVLKAKGDQSGLIDAVGGGGFGKYEARALGLILSPDLLISNNANVESDAQGNMYVKSKDAQGNVINRYGDESKLVDTGTTDGLGNKIFAEVTTDNSKRNKVSVVNTFVEKIDPTTGAKTYQYGGASDMNYTHIEGFDPIKMAVIAGMSMGAAKAMPFLSGLTTINAAGNTVATTAGTVLGAATGGGLASGLSGNNIITGALTAAVFAYGLDAVQKALQAAGGDITKLGKQLLSGDYSSFTEAGQNAAEAAASTSGVDGGGGGLAGGGESAASVDFGNTSVAQGGFPQSAIDYSKATGGFDEIADYLNKFNLDGTLKTIDLANSNFYTDGTKRFGNFLTTAQYDDLMSKYDISKWSNDQSLIKDYLDKTYGKNLTDTTISTVDLGNSTRNTDGTDRVVTTGGGAGGTGGTGGTGGAGGDGGLLGGGTLTTAGVVGGGLVVADKLVDALTPKAPAPTTYTSPLLTPGKAPLTQVPNFVQNYNNLFNRQGVGAGQFLGYDYLNNINVPPELMGLLGTSAQARPTSFTMPSMIANPA